MPPYSVSTVPDMTSDNPEEAAVTSAVKGLLEGTYKEVLDAVKHQDDKIGRLFTGIAFLTASALALANLGGGTFLKQRYVGWSDVPPVMLCLAAYILLVLASVTILIGSLATPLRVPGLSRGNKAARVEWVGPKASQIYFGEIARIGVRDWEAKWSADPTALEDELAQTLVGETHNLAVRTQFKYGRMNEAIALFNFALLFLSMAMIFSVAAASLPDTTKVVALPSAAHWALASAVAVFFYLQLLSQVRYGRQSMDELTGDKNTTVAFLRYVWVCCAAAWILVVGSGVFVDQPRALLTWGLAIFATVALFGATAVERKEKKIKPTDDKVQWIGPTAAIATGLVISYLATTCDDGEHGDAYAIVLVLVEATLLTLLAVMTPSLNLFRTVRRYKPYA